MTVSGHGDFESGVYNHPMRSAPSDLNVTSFLRNPGLVPADP